jgi:hypothetical protein
MNNFNLYRKLQTLQNLYDKVKDISDNDIEMTSHWAKYLCVLSAGFLESSLTEIYIDYSIKCSNSKVANFARSSLSRIHNPNTETFFQITNSFCETWGVQLTNYLDDNGRKEAINAIMKNRHKIAHGEKSDIGYHQLKSYFNKAIEVVDFIEILCK